MADEEDVPEEAQEAEEEAPAEEGGDEPPREPSQASEGAASEGAASEGAASEGAASGGAASGGAGSGGAGSGGAGSGGAGSEGEPAPDGIAAESSMEETPERPKIKRVQVRGSPPLPDEGDDTFYLPCLPSRPETNMKYRPVLYTFRVPNGSETGNIRNCVARRVPFYVLLDHAIAVIWTLLNAETEKTLGIAQLQWALIFLQAIFNRYGERPKDITFLVDTIQDHLLEQYAELLDELDILEDYDCTCSPPECADTSMGIKDYPFSTNYSEMIKFCPQPSTMYRVPSMTEEELNQELENIKAAAGVDSLQKLDSVSRDKAIDFLSSWKREQVEKIQAEIERLKSIENMLKNIDNQRFTGRIDQRQFEALLK